MKKSFYKVAFDLTKGRIIKSLNVKLYLGFNQIIAHFSFIGHKFSSKYSVVCTACHVLYIDQRRNV